MYYPSVFQPIQTGTLSNAYAQPRQIVPTVYYQAPTVAALPSATRTSTEANLIQQPQTTSTTTTRIFDPTGTDDSVIEETKTTTIVTKPQIPAQQTIVASTAANVPQVTTTMTAVSPMAETTKIYQKSPNPPRRFSSLSTSTNSDDTTTLTSSTVTPPPKIIQQPISLPPPVPIQTTTVAPVGRVLHRVHRLRMPGSFYSTNLGHEKRKIYKTDYKYRHYYCCNWCKGRWDLHNRSYGCCEWFYGCPAWGLIFCGLLSLALLAAFISLFALQPSINLARRVATAETHLLNRTELIYGFFQNCGFQINATVDTPTTLILCTNTATTTTARIELPPFNTVISAANFYFYRKILILLCYSFALANSKTINNV